MALVEDNYSFPKSIISFAGTFFIVTISTILAILLITSPIFYGGIIYGLPPSLSSFGYTCVTI